MNKSIKHKTDAIHIAAPKLSSFPLECLAKARGHTQGPNSAGSLVPILHQSAHTTHLIPWMYANVPA